MKVLIIGCGVVGAEVALGLSRNLPFVQLTVADIHVDSAQRVALRIGPSARALQLDIFNQPALMEAMKHHDVVFNSCGPFYKTSAVIVAAAVDAGVNYVDITDDHDAAKSVFLNEDYDRRAKANDCAILIGCGTTPGLTNVMAKQTADQLDETDSVRFTWVVPFLPRYFSPAAMDHLFHMVSGPVTQFLDGQYTDVQPLSGVRNVEFIEPFGTYPAYYSGHGEPVSVPRYIKGIREVTVRSCYFPQHIDDLVKSLVRAGMGSRDKLTDIGISPLQFITGFFKSDVGSRVFEDAKIVPNGWAQQVEVCGRRGQDQIIAIWETHGFFDDPTIDQNSTATAARIVIEELVKGNIKGKGVHGPEGCVDAPKYIDAVLRESGMKTYYREKVTRKTHG